MKVGATFRLMWGSQEMTRFDVHALLAELSAESPCGESLEYDEAYGQLELAIQGKPEHVLGESVVPAEAPDWTDVAKRATALLSRTKDLRIAVYLTRAALQLDGLAGFAKGLELIRGLLERYWDSVHPQLDPADNNDPTIRVNTVMALTDAVSMLQPLRESPLIASRSFGPVSFRDIALTTGSLESVEESEAARLTLEQIHAAFAECGLEVAEAALAGASEARDLVDAIERQVTEQVGVANAPNLDPLRATLSAICKALTENVGLLGGVAATVGAEGVADQTPHFEPAETAHPAQMAAANGQIRNRGDVVEALDKICAYYQRNEPSSPVPLLLRRAKRLVAKDFMEILRDMVPDGVAQAQTISGESSSGGSEDW